jgi:hypothetical protein
MPASSKAQQRFFGVVKAMQKGDKAKEGEAGKIAKTMSKDDVDKYASTKHKGKPEKVKREQRVRNLIKKMVREIMAEDFAGSYPKEKRASFDKKRQKQSEVLGYKLTGTPDIKTEIDDATVHEAKKRDYKAEYKKFQSSTKSKKYRAELNAYNRKKGTYGNGDGKDASHKGGKIVGFEAESKNRGRAEKSRLKKEVRIPFSSSHIKQLKRAFKDMKGTLPDNNPLVQQIVTLLKKTDKKVLKQIASADIKYLSDKAKDILGEGRGPCWKGYTQKGMKKKGDKMVPNCVKNEGKLNEAKETIFDVAARVMKDKQAYGYKTKKGLVKVDMQTANLLTKVFKKVNPKMKKILSDIGYKSPTQLMNTLWAVVK